MSESSAGDRVAYCAADVTSVALGLRRRLT